MPGGVAEQTGKVVEGKMRIREGGGINTTLTSGMEIMKIQAEVCGSERFSFKIKTCCITFVCWKDTLHHCGASEVNSV